MEATAAGAMSAVKLVAYVVANLIAFLALISFLDAAVAYFAGRVGFQSVTFMVRDRGIYLTQSYDKYP